MGKISFKTTSLELRSSYGLSLSCPVCTGGLMLKDTIDGDQAYWCHTCERGWRAGHLPPEARKAKGKLEETVAAKVVQPEPEVVQPEIATKTPKIQTVPRKKLAADKQTVIARATPSTTIAVPTVATTSPKPKKAPVAQIPKVTEALPTPTKPKKAPVARAVPLPEVITQKVPPARTKPKRVAVAQMPEVVPRAVMPKPKKAPTYPMMPMQSNLFGE